MIPLPMITTAFPSCLRQEVERTKRAIVFRLSNKVAQVNFKDHIEVVLSSECKVVAYVNKKGKRTCMQLSEALESSDLEMNKRLKYTKDILNHMMNRQGTGSP